jgi:predicted  nucleic acid-binding Zn-ribbon protein
MADVVTQTKPITRNKLAQWLPNHEAVKALEKLTADVPMLGETANSLQAQLDAASTQISQLQTQASALTLRVTTLETEVLSLQQAVSDTMILVSKYNALRAQLGTFAKFVTDFNSRPKP